MDTTDKDVSERLFHNSERDVVVTITTGLDHDASFEDINTVVKELIRGLVVTVYNGKGRIDFVYFPYSELFLLYFKACLLPSERQWNSHRKMWTIRDNGIAKLTRLCNAMEVKIQYMGLYTEEEDSYLPS